jgi:hypothetical protein
VKINLISIIANHDRDVDGLVSHLIGDVAFSDLFPLLPPWQLVARQVSRALYRFSCTKSNVTYFVRSTLPQKACSLAMIVSRISSTIVTLDTKPILRTKSNHYRTIICFIDSEWELCFLVWEYLALIDEVIPHLLS